MIAKPDARHVSFPTNAVSEAVAATIFDRAPFGLSLTSAAAASYGRYLAANPAYVAMTGYDEETLRARRFHDVVHPTDLPDVLFELDLLGRDPQANGDAEVRLIHRDGSSVWVRQRRSIVRDERGDPLYFLTHTEALANAGSSERATFARREAEVALRESEARYRMIADFAADMIVRTRADRTRAYVSPASKSLLGFEPQELIEMDFGKMLHPDDLARVALEYDTFLASGTDETHTYRLRHKNGTYVWVEAHWVAARSVAGNPFGDGETAVISIVRDISERKAAEAQIALLACQDPLSGLANRVLFGERLQQALAEIARGAIVAIVSIDLDDFKSVNDTHGHAIGDALLRAVADRLRSSVRAGDTVARLGGDEFAVVLANLSAADEASLVAGHILEALGRPYDLEGACVTIGASIGVTTAPTDGTEADRLLKNADLALYRAKDEGRNTCRVFGAEMESRSRERRTLECDLRRALAEREFCVYYQPMIELASRKIVAFEALARWRHPDRGLVPPVEFIAIAEQTGAIVELGAWVLRDACATAATWPANLRLAVNLSAVQCKDRELTRTVVAALRDSGLAADRLDLEITESVLFLESESTLATLAALRAIGVGISLDDFGTGYSSLRHIRSLKFDKLKIDRSFVEDMARNVGSAAIVRAVIGLGESLGIATIAEGIETPEQLHALRERGCTHGQGFLLGRPMPSAEVAGFVATFDGARA